MARDEGSAPVEFVLVGTLLTLLVLSVLQLGLALHVRNTVADAASEGARAAALAGASAADGAERTRRLIAAALGPGYRVDVAARALAGMAEVTVRADLPVLGLVGPTRALEVAGHAPLEDPLG